MGNASAASVKKIFLGVDFDRTFDFFSESCVKIIFGKVFQKVKNKKVDFFIESFL